MMGYKRFTMRIGTDYVALNCHNCKHKNSSRDCSINCTKETKNRLAEIEDKIEQGLLIELQDNEHNLIGQQVYSIDICSFPKGKIVANFDDEEIIIGFTSEGIVGWNSTACAICYHKNGLWFLTKAEAEAKLRELQGAER